MGGGGEGIINQLMLAWPRSKKRENAGQAILHTD